MFGRRGDVMTGKPFLAGLFVRLPFDEAPVEAWVPDDPSDVNVGLVIEIGWNDREGTTLFYARVATPEALRKTEPRPDTKHIISTRALIVMSRYDQAELVLEVERTLKWASSRETQEEVLRYLTRYYGWEYEDPTTEPG
jgi:Immunity protein 8